METTTTRPALTLFTSLDTSAGYAVCRGNTAFNVKGSRHAQNVGRCTETRRTVSGMEHEGDIYTYASANVLTARGERPAELPTVERGAVISIDGELFVVELMRGNRDQITLTPVAA